jgi:hypothetical protein
MAKVYFLRHQAAGVISKYPFSQPPTDEQKAAVERELFQAVGKSHPKTGESYWTIVVEADVLGPGDVPEVPERSLSVAGEGARPDVDRVSVSARAHVQNP